MFKDGDVVKSKFSDWRARIEKGSDGKLYYRILTNADGKPVSRQRVNFLAIRREAPRSIGTPMSVGMIGA